MSFRIPTFPLFCRIYQAQGNGPFPLAGGVQAPCQLLLRKDGLVAGLGSGTGVSPMLLLLPKGTDIRPTHNAVLADAVQVPDGSGNYYGVSFVGDVAKGFLNEYRVAAIFLKVNVANGSVWPMP